MAIDQGTSSTRTYKYSNEKWYEENIRTNDALWYHRYGKSPLFNR
jgi:hypothetical protein